jgi:hypothetical protein
MSLAFHRSSARRGNGDTLCPYVQGPKDEGEKAVRYKQQFQYILVSYYAFQSHGCSFVLPLPHVIPHLCTFCVFLIIELLKQFSNVIDQKDMKKKI